MKLEKYKKTTNNNNSKNSRIYLCMPRVAELSNDQLQKLRYMQQNYDTNRLCIDFLIQTYNEIHKGK